MRAVAATLCLLALPSLAAAEAEPDRKKDRSHRLQGGIGVSVGSGYRVQFKYGDAGTCGRLGENGKPANSCFGRMPTYLDLKLFLGVSHSVDVLIENRFGLERAYPDANDPTAVAVANQLFVLMPGIRVYAGGRSPFKFGVQIQLVFDYNETGTTGNSKFDFGVRETNMFQWDLLRWMCAYLQIGANFAFLRSFTFQLEAGAGIEGRFP